MEILTSQTQNMGSYSYYYYQLEDSNGNPLTGPGYSVEEHIVYVEDTLTDIPNGNSNGVFVPMTNGEAVDQVGLSEPSQVNGVEVSLQTFTVQYRGQDFDLSSEFQHETWNNNGVASNSVIDIRP